MAAAIATDSDRTMGRISPHAYFNGRVSPPTSNTVLTKALILDAIARSNDDGSTLDLSNKNLNDVGEPGAEELAQIGRGEDLLDECRILRIALVGNNLSSLPMSFARLSRLRYLTLRSNAFSVFPEVLTTMPSLEILDFSRNRIRGLPTNPGSLVSLRVLSISRNKIRKLPSYLWKFKNLTVLKADHNPVEWPPKHIMEPEEEDLEDSDVMHRWVDSLKSWIAENGEEEDRRVEFHSSEVLAMDSDDVEPFSEHSRSTSVDSEQSIYSTSSYVNSLKDCKPDSPPPIDTAIISPSITEGISTSPESYLPTPESSLPSADDDTARALPNAHGRNKSYASAHETRAGVPGLSVQKSLPDLRLANGRIPLTSQMRSRAPSTEARKKTSNESFSSVAESSTSGFEVPLRSRPPRGVRHEPLPSISESKPPSIDFERNSYFRRLSTLPVSTISRTTPTTLLTVVDSVRGILFAVSQIYQSLQHYTVNNIDERLSAVLKKVLDPAYACMLQLIDALDQFDSTSKRGCPPPSACRRVIESCRDNVAMFGKAVGVLSMQLKVFALRDDVRYSRQMLLLIYGATAEISNSWQGITPQLDSIEHLLRDDRPSPLPSPGMVTPTLNRTAPLKFSSQTSSNRVLIPPIAEQPEPSPTSDPPIFPRPPPLSRAHSAQPPLSSSPTAPAMRPAQSEGRSRMSRRHAGSFSVKDVEIGRSLPSNNESPPPISGVASGSSTPTPRSHTVALRSFTLSGSPGPVPPLPSSHPLPFQPQPSPGLHSRQSSAQNSAASTPQLSYSVPSKSVADASVSSNGLVVDKEALDAMAAAVRVAPAVWAMLEEISNEMSGMPLDVRGSLVKAQAVTRRLGDNIRVIQEGHLNADRKALREDAHVFVKSVISLSKIVKDYGAAHRLSGQLRSDIAKLTNATQGFVMLLHVSSFAPNTPRPFSPAVGANQSTTMTPNGATATPISNTSSQSPSIGGLTVSVSDERPQLGNTGAGLSRSRSAQPPASSKLVPSATPSSMPKSALPHQQNFKIPTTPRANGVSRLRNGELAPSMDGGLSVDGYALANGL